ncbi:BAHD acyltransferase DCR-like [Trifolium medium]|uniref:BAHD acyltransferase DCR-like n=1 Tax=Trifolium medium TaxID=97028 RepID=A0A392Q7Q5_9FABA|nr:BAHD acyltransferase DCR-like [Trifolium medium]
MLRKLKDGLSLVLEDFHKLGGKLGRDDEGVFKVEYDDEMAGWCGGHKGYVIITK